MEKYVVIYASTRESDSAETCPPERVQKNLKKFLTNANGCDIMTER